MGRSINAKQPAKNIASNPPTRKRMMVDGVVVTEKLNPMQAKRKMVGLDGSPYELSLANGYTTKLNDRSNVYGAQILADKMKKGHIPYDECPVAKGYIPVAEGDRACPGSDGRGKFSSEECCDHVKRVMKARGDVYRAQQMDYLRNSETHTEKLVKLVERQALTGVAAAPADVRPAKGMPRG